MMLSLCCSVALQEDATHEDMKHRTDTPEWVLHFKNEKDAVATYEQIVLIVTELTRIGLVAAGQGKGDASSSSAATPQKRFSISKQLSREKLFGMTKQGSSASSLVAKQGSSSSKA